ncbi:aminotransferase [Chytriomyces hyalinus]|nr:aminotransferase [Chytriomyces hyalinus]
MRLRARFENETKAVGLKLTPQSSLAELKAELAEMCNGLPVQIRAGFPPRLLANNNDDTLSQCGIKDGDQLTVVIDKDAPQQPATPPNPANPLSQKSPSLSKSDELIPVSNGAVLVRQMTDDNSCLFNSIAYIFERNASAATKMRNLVADAIAQDPIEYNEAVLGKTPAAYTAWIRKLESWGGAIELAAFTKHFKCEIWSIDVSTLRVDRFGEGRGFERVAVLFYSGIHYDAVALSPVASADETLKEFDVTLFSAGVEAEEVLAACLKLAGIWKQKHKFTDLGSFTLRCDVCKDGLKGQNEAQAHAKQTGHTRFVEYS